MAIITFVIFVRFYEPPTLLADLIGANPSCAFSTSVACVLKKKSIFHSSFLRLHRTAEQSRALVVLFCFFVCLIFNIFNTVKDKSANTKIRKHTVHKCFCLLRGSTGGNSRRQQTSF